jgi:uncharacterized protein YodC (DUF2158 family)
MEAIIMVKGVSKATEVKEKEVRKEELWGRYWIRAGLEVVSRNDVTDLNRDRLSLYKMVVEKVVKRSKDGKNGERKVFIEGVKCHWVDNDRKYQVGQFHTNELVPFEIAVKGVEEVNRWIQRQGIK